MELQTDSPTVIEICRTAAAAGLRPDPLLTVSEWSDEYRILSAPLAPAQAGGSEDVETYLTAPYTTGKVVAVSMSDGSKVEGKVTLRVCLHSSPRRRECSHRNDPIEN